MAQGQPRSKGSWEAVVSVQGEALGPGSGSLSALAVEEVHW